MTVFKYKNGELVQVAGNSGGGSGSTIPPDTELSETSENAVQNKIITAKLSEILEELNKKFNASDIKRYPIETYISSDGNTWYTVYNDGWKECGGYVAITSASTGYAKVTLPITFNNKKYTLIATSKSTSTSALVMQPRNYIVNTNTVEFRLCCLIGGTSSFTDGEVLYYCCGY